MLESTMEILQQFYIAIEDPVKEFELFNGVIEIIDLTESTE